MTEDEKKRHFLSGNRTGKTAALYREMTGRNLFDDARKRLRDLAPTERMDLDDAKRRHPPKSDG